MGGKCESIAILRVDSWRVKSVFKSDNGVSYEAISHTMHKLLTQPRLDSGISFERYAAAMKCLGGVDIEVSVKDGIATFKGRERMHVIIYDWRSWRTILHDTRRASKTTKQVYGGGY